MSSRQTSRLFSMVTPYLAAMASMCASWDWSVRKMAEPTHGAEVVETEASTAMTLRASTARGMLLMLNKGWRTRFLGIRRAGRVEGGASKIREHRNEYVYFWLASSFPLVAGASPLPLVTMHAGQEQARARAPESEAHFGLGSLALGGRMVATLSLRAPAPRAALGAAVRRLASFSPADLEAYRGKIAPDLASMTSERRADIDKKAKLLEWDSISASYSSVTFPKKPGPGASKDVLKAYTDCMVAEEAWIDEKLSAAKAHLDKLIASKLSSVRVGARDVAGEGGEAHGRLAARVMSTSCSALVPERRGPRCPVSRRLIFSLTGSGMKWRPRTPRRPAVSHARRTPSPLLPCPARRRPQKRSAAGQRTPIPSAPRCRPTSAS